MDPWRRNYRAVWPSLFATSMGLMAFLPTLALYVAERFEIEDPQQRAFWGATVYGAAPLAAALAGPVWGALGDRVGKRPMAIRANLAIALTTALMPFAPSPFVLLLMRALQGVLAGYVAPAMALVSQAAPRELHGIVIARLQVAMAVGSVLGPLLGSAVNHFCGRAALFWVTSVFSGLAALRLHLCAEEVLPDRAGRVTFLREMARGMLDLVRGRVFAWLLFLVLLLRLGQNMLEPFLAPFARELGTSVVWRSWIADPKLALEVTIATPFAIMGVAQLLFTPWWGRLADRLGPLRCLSILGCGLAVVLAATATVATIDEFLLLRCAAAVLMSGSMTLAYAAASKRVPDARRTLSFSLVQSCMQLGFGTGPQVGAWVATLRTGGSVDYRQAFVAAAALCGAAGLGMIWLRRSGGTLESAPPVTPVDDCDESASPPPRGA